MSGFEPIVSACKYLLYNCPEAEEHLAYLNSRIGADVQEKFEFGYFPGSEKLNLLIPLVGQEALTSLGMMQRKEYQDSVSASRVTISYFEYHQLIMPYKDLYGNVIGLVGRSLLADEERKQLTVQAKYKNTSFSKGNHMFGLFEAKQSILENDIVYVVEGQFDVIKCFEKGIKNVVAIGSSNLTFHQLSLLCRYTKNICLLLDNDEAGDSGRKKIYDKYSQYANIINKFRIPKGYKDIDEYLKENSFDQLNALF